jgi:hypothetical protein
MSSSHGFLDKELLALTAYAYDAPEYVDLELYLMWRARAEDRDTRHAPIITTQIRNSTN